MKLAYFEKKIDQHTLNLANKIVKSCYAVPLNDQNLGHFETNFRSNLLDLYNKIIVLEVFFCLEMFPSFQDFTNETPRLHHFRTRTRSFAKRNLHLRYYEGRCLLQRLGDTENVALQVATICCIGLLLLVLHIFEQLIDRKKFLQKFALVHRMCNRLKMRGTMCVDYSFLLQRPYINT